MLQVVIYQPGSIYFTINSNMDLTQVQRNYLTEFQVQHWPALNYYRAIGCLKLDCWISSWYLLWGYSKKPLRPPFGKITYCGAGSLSLCPTEQETVLYPCNATVRDKQHWNRKPKWWRPNWKWYTNLYNTFLQLCYGPVKSPNWACCLYVLCDLTLRKESRMVILT